MSHNHVTRRELVASAGAVGALAAGIPEAWAKPLLSRRARIGPGRFRDGVASGEPAPRAVTFWSRLRTSRPRSGARLIVAKDPDMRRVVATTVVPTGRGVDGSLKARVGGLKPATEYYYVWESGSDVSPVGRTRTAPPTDAVEHLRIAFSSCQQYVAGYFGAHAHAAAQDLDLYLFLGDYVYERPDAARTSVRNDGITAIDLRSYRQKYALYRSDPGLRELHRVHPVAHIWDDHELANNYSTNGDPPARAQRAAAYRAAFEWLPRMTFPRERHRLYKRLSLGGTADVFLLDERQYRTNGADGRPRQMLGEAQMSWLIDQLQRSSATWKIIAQQVVMAGGIAGEDNELGDAWHGYAEDRTRLLGEIEAAGIQNAVVLTGDAHAFMANQLASDFQALGEGRARPSAIEYVGGSVTSLGREVQEWEVQQSAPWNRQYDAVRHGYAYMDVTPELLLTEYRASERTTPADTTVAFERFTQPAGANDFTRQSV